MLTVAKPPKLRFHSPSGQYLVAMPQLGGKPKYVYLGRNKDAAQEQYNELLQTLTVQPASAFSPSPTAVQRVKGVTVQQAATALIEYVCSEKPSEATERRRLATQCLRLFVERHGTMPIEAVDTDHLEALRADLSKTHAPKTVNHYVGTVKRLIKFSAYKKWRTPLEMTFVRPVPVPAPKPKNLTVEQLSSMLDAAKNKNYRSLQDNKSKPLYNSLRLQLLGALRPSEVVRLLKGEYEEVEEGVLMLTKGKTDDSASMRRYVLLPAFARKLLKETKVNYEEPRAYLFQSKRATKRTPHRLRHTGAFLLHRMPERATREETDIILGHYPNSVSATYNPLHWDEYMPIMERYAKHLSSLMPQHF